MTAQIEWIQISSGDEKRYRAMIVGWQNSQYAINQLIQSYNALTLQAQPKPDQHEPMRIIAVRRQIVASLLELKNRLDEWVGHLNKAKLDCNSINGLRKSLREALDRAESWRSIRNLTFHYGDILEDPDDLLAIYHAISLITDAEVNSVWKAMTEVGMAARNVSLDNT